MMTAGRPAQPFKLTRPTIDGVRTQYFTTAGQRDHVAHQLADSTGSVVYTFHWQPTPQSQLLDQGWVNEANIVPGLDEAGYLTISLTVLNMYEKYADVTTTFTDVRIPAPPGCGRPGRVRDLAVRAHSRSLHRRRPLRRRLLVQRHRHRLLRPGPGQSRVRLRLLAARRRAR